MSDPPVTRPPYFPFYVLDFAGDPVVEAMDTTAVGAYILLLCKAWHLDPPASLPDDDRVLARYARIAFAEWTHIREQVLAAFVKGDDGRFHQKRLRREFDKFAVKSAKARASARTRWGERFAANAMRSHSDCIANAMQRAYGSGSGSKSGSTEGECKGETKPAKGKCTDSQAEAIYALYPRKVAKQAALKAIKAAINRLAGEHDDPVGWLQSRVADYAASPAGRDPPPGGDDYRPHPATWMNAGRWEDDATEWSKTNGNGAISAADRRRAEQEAELAKLIEASKTENMG